MLWISAISQIQLRIEPSRHSRGAATLLGMRPNFPERGTSSLRSGRNSVANRWYLLTFCTHNRAPLFGDASFAAMATALIFSPALWRACFLHSWVVMPDHVHALCLLRGESVSKLMQRVKAVSAAELRHEMQTPVPIWMPGFHDHALRSDAQVAAASMYIAMNPVRAGLVQSPDDYPYWGIQSDPPASGL